jgi:homoserine O-succinyltransferase
MPLILDTARSQSAADAHGGNCITIGFVNNMPDGAWYATERQFINLIRAAAPETVVRLKLFSIPQVPRSDQVRGEFADRYRGISALWNMPLDGLVVTGTEPLAARLEDELYWPVLTELVDWARENTISTIWSCLAAHAAVRYADGVERRPLADKLFGVFECKTVAAHPLVNGPARLRVPHSRLNDLPETALASTGYRILSRSNEAGVDTFVKEASASSLYVFFQGHPEYDDDSLLREYRRDIGRFLSGERPNYPAIPQGYFDEQAMALANAFRALAVDECRADLMTHFPTELLEAGLKNTWRGFAAGFYRDWLGFLKGRKAELRLSAAPVRRSGRGAPNARLPRPRPASRSRRIIDKTATHP